jgi:hypothetical protein
MAREFLYTITLHNGLTTAVGFANIAASDLPANIAYTNVANVFTANQTFSGGISGITAGDLPATVAYTNVVNTFTASNVFADITTGAITALSIDCSGGVAISGEVTIDQLVSLGANLQVAGNITSTGGIFVGDASGLTGIPTSVSNSDGSLTISPTTGAVVASIALAHANVWTGQQTFTATSSSTVGVIVKGAAFQSVDLVQWKDSTPTIMAAINKDGRVLAGGIAGEQPPTVPGLGFYNDQDNGFFLRTTNTFGFMTAGTIRGYFKADGSLYLTNDPNAATVTPPASQTLKFYILDGIIYINNTTGSDVDAVSMRGGDNAGDKSGFRFVGNSAHSLARVVCEQITSGESGTLDVYTAPSNATGLVLRTRVSETGRMKLTQGGSTGFCNLGGVIFNHFADAGNGTTVETDLVSDTTAASCLNVNGDKLEGEYGGTFVSSATATRQIKLYFGGTAIFDTGTLTLSLSSAWTMYATIIRVSATVVRYMVSLATEGAALSAYTAVGELTGLTLSATNIMKVTGQAAGVGAASNDIVLKLSSLSWHPAA